MSDWTEELKQEVVDAYEAADPTPENSMEIVQELAEKYEKTVNGIRMILSKAGVYVKKASTSKPSSGEKKTTTTRVSKDDAIKSLSDAISAAGLEPDAEILAKLTGKAAIYFASVITEIRKDA